MAMEALLKRRCFLLSALVAAVSSQLTRVNPAQASVLLSDCRDDAGTLGLSGLSMAYFSVRHQHEFIIPLEVLIHPPAKGYSARCSAPIKDRSDIEALKHRTDDQGKPLDLSEHGHTVSLTRDELKALASGQHVTVDLPKFGHKFYFVADNATLAAIQSVK